MAWTTAHKAMDITYIQPNVPTHPAALGRAPGISTISFKPLELYGAAARCSFLNAVDPLLVTPQSNVMAALISIFVDDPGVDFAILQSADDIKDFAKSYFSGTVAQGLAYLTMLRDGYSWLDHFELLSGGAPAMKKRPDFVFIGNGSGAALMESKGSRSQPLTTFDATVAAGYTDQVDPHLGHAIGGATATHGYSIGAHLQSLTKAELRIHYTEPMPASGGGDHPADLVAVQRGDMATALSLALSPRMGADLRRGAQSFRVQGYAFEWQGRTWISRPRYEDDYIDWDWPRPWRPGLPPFGPNPVFAIDEETAVLALNRFASPRTEPGAIEPLERLLLADKAPDSDEPVAVFPDGLAVFGADARLDGIRPVYWHPDDGHFYSR